MEINHDGQYSVKCKNRNIIDSVISTVAAASASLAGSGGRSREDHK